MKKLLVSLVLGVSLLGGAVIALAQTTEAAPAVTSPAPMAAAVEAELAGKGRVVLRPSGTEPVVRVMVEAQQADVAKQAAEKIARAIEAASA